MDQPKSLPLVAGGAVFSRRGDEFLRQFAVTLDATNHRVRLDQGPASDKESPEQARRDGIRLRSLSEEPLDVLGVDSASPAEKAGLQKGDVLLRINDTIVKSLSPEERERSLRGSPLKLQVQRGRQLVELRLTLDTESAAGRRCRRDDTRRDEHHDWLSHQ